MYKKIMSLPENRTRDPLLELRSLLMSVYGPFERTLAEGLTVAYTRSGYVQDIPRILHSTRDMSGDTLGTIIDNVITAYTAPDKAEFLTGILERYGRNAILAYQAITVLAKHGRTPTEVRQFFALIARYEPTIVAGMWPYLSRVLALPVEPMVILNANKTGLFDSIMDTRRFMFDPNTRKFGWSYDLLRYGIPAERIYSPEGKNGILDQVSFRYTNGVARKVVTSLIGIAQKAQLLHLPGYLRTNSDNTGLFDRFPAHYHYNDLSRLEAEVERVHARFNYFLQQGDSLKDWTMEEVELLVREGTVTVSWSKAVRPMELR